MYAFSGIRPLLAAGAAFAAAGLLSPFRATADTAPAAPPAPAAAAAAGDHALLLQLAAGNRQLAEKVDADRAVIVSLRSQLAAQQTRLDAVSARTDSAATGLAALAAHPDASTNYGPFTVSGKEVYLTGYNLHIQSGSGSTSGKVNGYGNVIIGYDESRGSGKDHRTGSHNLIVGDEANYTAYGGIVAGHENSISANYASVTGGRSNQASGQYAGVSGGYQNVASGTYSSISGGYQNTSTGDYASAIGGQYGVASGEYSLAAGGVSGEADGLSASAFGGDNGTALGDYSCVLGGVNNEAAYDSTVIAGGYGNQANGSVSCVFGGVYDQTSGYYAVDLGGGSNSAIGIYSTVTGGYNNKANGDYSSVSGGEGISEPNTEGWAAGTYESH